jgi:prevent-host-death family protein
LSVIEPWAQHLHLDKMATCGHYPRMTTVSIRDAKNRLTQLARQVEKGETIVVTRNGRPAFDLVPHKPRRGLRLEAIDEFKKMHGITTIVASIADDFDDPLPEDFLLIPLPPDA